MTGDACTPADAADLLGQLDQFEGAQYLALQSGEIALNESGVRFRQVRNRMENLAVAMDRSLAGAMWADLFLRCPWLSDLTVRLWSEPEFDDEGGMYLSFHSSVSDVTLIAGEVVPAELCSDDGPDEDLVMEHLEDDIEEFDAEAHQALAGGRTGAVDLTRVISRGRLASLQSAGWLLSAPYSRTTKEVCDRGTSGSSGPAAPPPLRRCGAFFMQTPGFRSGRSPSATPA